jgi:hypothetical protein
VLVNRVNVEQEHKDHNRFNPGAGRNDPGANDFKAHAVTDLIFGVKSFQSTVPRARRDARSEHFKNTAGLGKTKKTRC